MGYKGLSGIPNSLCYSRQAKYLDSVLLVFEVPTATLSQQATWSSKHKGMALSDGPNPSYAHNIYMDMWADEPEIRDDGGYLKP